MVGTRRLLLVAAMAYVLPPTQVLAESADVDSAIQKASSGDSKVGRVDPPGTTGKPVGSNNTGPVPTATNQSLGAAGNGSNGTRAATPSPPTRGPGDAVLHFGEDNDAVDRTPKRKHSSIFSTTWCDVTNKSIRKLKTADRIKLLAASSDEEF
ncbi:hypothetical protein IscW_ISCW019076 [Ixodes scapularis]|uniref:Secreted protein n=1 Tax=Ixodes scapularis TaxID=6945 RepID=B7PP93_IXOSC|nr:hypothetical protein IscW_ISCW019076 [Ixodes scapularis]|eukprot:XP_002435585.1 hypothetical protein IscW_ISCW019076 [Ixodes scapularis]